MPPHLEELYRKRDNVGSGELKSSVDEIKAKLSQHLTPEETKHGLWITTLSIQIRRMSNNSIELRNTLKRLLVVIHGVSMKALPSDWQRIEANHSIC